MACEPVMVFLSCHRCYISIDDGQRFIPPSIAISSLSYRITSLGHETDTIKMPLAPAVSAQARQVMSTAFEELEATITPQDSRHFHTSSLQDVKNAALEIETQLAARQSLRNMRRLMPLFKALEHYSKAVDVLCNGTPYLPWIWAPITLILQTASDYVEAFEHIIKGYSRIASSLQRFELLGTAFADHQEFHHTLAVFYADILQFHKYAYKFVRRSGAFLTVDRYTRRINFPPQAGSYYSLRLGAAFKDVSTIFLKT